MLCDPAFAVTSPRFPPEGEGLVKGGPASASCQEPDVLPDVGDARHQEEVAGEQRREYLPERGEVQAQGRRHPPPLRVRVDGATHPTRSEPGGEQHPPELPRAVLHHPVQARRHGGGGACAPPDADGDEESLSGQHHRGRAAYGRHEAVSGEASVSRGHGMRVSRGEEVADRVPPEAIGRDIAAAATLDPPPPPRTVRSRAVRPAPAGPPPTFRRRRRRRGRPASRRRHKPGAPIL